MTERDKDELTNYIVVYYSHLMTPDEAEAYRTWIAEQKITNSDSPAMQAAIRKHWVSTKPEVMELLRNGPEEFVVSVRDRILREHSDQVFLNHCPRCNALANTPQARQCPRCYFDWHGADTIV